MSAEFVVLFVACGSSQHNKFFQNHFHLIFLRKVLPIIDLSTNKILKNLKLLLTMRPHSVIIIGRDKSAYMYASVLE